MSRTAALFSTVFLLAALSLAFVLQSQKTVYDFKVLDIDGKETSLKKYEGKVLLIVNVASKCGLTPQYEELQALYEEYKGQDFEILAFPANNFMGQEPGSNAEIKAFCSSKYNVSFPIFAKISVKGKKIAPLYSYLTQKSENGKLDAPVSWNFQKFLINKQGEVVESFAPRTKVSGSDFRTALKRALKK